MTKQNKQLWEEPKISVYGDFQELTLAMNKSFGTGDAFTFQGIPTKISG